MLSMNGPLGSVHTELLAIAMQKKGGKFRYG